VEKEKSDCLSFNVNKKWWQVHHHQAKN